MADEFVPEIVPFDPDSPEHAQLIAHPDAHVTPEDPIEVERGE